MTVATVRLPFLKMEGLGNDFVVFDCSDDATMAQRVREIVPELCDRRHGVGADGVLLICRSEESGADCEMTVWNADGGSAEMCGNGLRCVGLFATEAGWGRPGSIRVRTGSGILEARVLEETSECWRVRIELGVPRIEEKIVGAGGSDGTCLSLGNPHCVVFLSPGDPALEDFPVDRFGPLIEQDVRFPEGTNVEFVQVEGPGNLVQRTWERGVGETMACGTGAGASAVAHRLILEREACQSIPNRTTVALPGGPVTIEWEGLGSIVYLEGSARKVFAGTWPIDR